jgi:hypothetical protein
MSESRMKLQSGDDVGEVSTKGDGEDAGEEQGENGLYMGGRRNRNDHVRRNAIWTR